MGKLHLDICYQPRLLVGGSKLSVRILLNDLSFYFVAKDKYRPSMEFIEAALFTKRSRVNHMVVEAHNKALQISTAKYPITHAKVKACTLQRASTMRI